MSGKPQTARIYVLLARKSPHAVVFRRGPSKQVLMLTWDTAKHEFRSGQWFKGRIYERRCDLSPSGEKLIYFAAKYRDPYQTWTAVSRPPFFTALALWPKGDAWGGGGLFRNERILHLNHRSNEMKLGEGFRLPKTIDLQPFGDVPGWGEDEPIYGGRLARDGWVLRQSSKAQWKYGAEISFQFPEPILWTKAKGPWVLEMRILGLHQRDGPWYVLEHRVLDAAGETVLSLGRSDWADWSRSGELLFARQGRLYRSSFKPSPCEPEELIDLRDFRFEPVEPPREAKLWGGEPLGGQLLSR